MPCSVINHGEWKIYKPARPPKGAAKNIMYAQRKKDKKDWYELMEDEASFEKDSLKITCWFVGDKWVVMAVNRDATMLFPGGAILLEVTGYEGKNPQEELGRRVYDPDANKFSEDKAY